MSLEGLSWAQLHKHAQQMAATARASEIVRLAEDYLTSSKSKERQLGTYLLGFAETDRAASLATLRRLAVPGEDWEVQEAVAQAFDECCATIGYEAALSTIDAWLADTHPNARRAVSEGLRPWTAKRRAYFAAHPEQAIRRLAALRRDDSAYVRHSAGNALRDIRRRFPELLGAETAGWDLDDPLVQYTYRRVLGKV
jgi:hypothetical protein